MWMFNTTTCIPLEGGSGSKPCSININFGFRKKIGNVPQMFVLFASLLTSCTHKCMHTLIHYNMCADIPAVVRATQPALVWAPSIKWSQLAIAETAGWTGYQRLLLGLLLTGKVSLFFLSLSISLSLSLSLSLTLSLSLPPSFSLPLLSPTTEHNKHPLFLSFHV